MSTISLVMIVKNEEPVLERCINSIKDIIDEFIIVDTGSTDNTKEIIKKYGKLYEHEWIGDVVNKQKAIELATCDYGIIMDADEVVISGLDKLKNYAEGGVNAVSGLIIEGEPIHNQYHRIRLWKNNKIWKYDGPGMHGCMVGSDNVIYDNSIVVKHSHENKSDDRKDYKTIWNGYIEKISNFLKDNPNDSRALFYLARTYRDLGKTDDAIIYYEKYINSNSNFRDEKYQALYDLATCWRVLGEYEKVFDVCKKAIEIDPRRAEVHNLMGYMFYNIKDWENAIKHFEKSVNLPFPEDVTLFINPQEYFNIPRDCLSLCYYNINKHDLSIKFTEEVIKQQINKRMSDNLVYYRKKPNSLIFMLLGKTIESVYGGVINERGIYGVETTYIELSKGLSELGMDVFLFCACEKAHIYEGVYYIPYQDLPNYTNLDPNLVITSRWVECLDEFDKKKTKMLLWTQDVYPESYATKGDLFNLIDNIVVSTNWHKNIMYEKLGHKFDFKNLNVIPLGIDKSLYVGKNIVRVPTKVIYSSSPDRGLDYVLDIWSDISERVKDIELHIYYGWDGWMKADFKKATKNRNDVIEKIRPYNNIFLRGRMKKSDLANEMLSSGLCLYTCNFFETFCITALETQASGVPMITNYKAAVKETLNSKSNIIIPKFVVDDTYKEDYINKVDFLLNNKNILEKYSRECVEYILQLPCDWSDITKRWYEMILRIL